MRQVNNVNHCQRKNTKLPAIIMFLFSICLSHSSPAQIAKNIAELKLLCAKECYNEFDKESAQKFEDSADAFFKANIVINKNNFGNFRKVMMPFLARLSRNTEFLYVISRVMLTGDDDTAFDPKERSDLMVYLNSRQNAGGYKEIPKFEILIDRYKYKDGLLVTDLFTLKAQLRYAEQFQLGRLFYDFLSSLPAFKIATELQQSELFFDYVNLKKEISYNDIKNLKRSVTSRGGNSDNLAAIIADNNPGVLSFFSSIKINESVLKERGWTLASFVETVSSPMGKLRVYEKPLVFMEQQMGFTTYYFNSDCSIALTSSSTDFYNYKAVGGVYEKNTTNKLEFDKSKYFVGEPIVSSQYSTQYTQKIRDCASGESCINLVSGKFAFCEHQLNIIKQKRSDALRTRDFPDYETALYKDVYNEIYEMITAKTPSLYDKAGNIILYDEKPKAGVSYSTWQFLKDVKDVNSGNKTGYGEFVTNYNKIQHKIRLNTIDDSRLIVDDKTALDRESQRASNYIAESIVADILNIVPAFINDIKIVLDNPNHFLPTIDKIATLDAKRGVTYTDLFPKNIGGWAGNPFFLFLAHNLSFEQNITHTKNEKGELINTLIQDDNGVPIRTSNLSKEELKAIKFPVVITSSNELAFAGNGETYDILALYNSLITATDATGYLTGLEMFLTKVISVLSKNDLNSFFKAIKFADEAFTKSDDILKYRYEGSDFDKLNFSTRWGLFRNEIISKIPEIEDIISINKSLIPYLLGVLKEQPSDFRKALVLGKSLNDNDIKGTDDNNLIHSGNGDDKILVSNGYDLVDGGVGNDDMFYSDHDGRVYVEIRKSSTLSNEIYAYKLSKEFALNSKENIGGIWKHGSISALRQNSDSDIFSNKERDAIYNVESLSGTQNDDEFAIQESGFHTIVRRINGLDGQDILTMVGNGVFVNLKSKQAYFLKDKDNVIAIENFEHLHGTNKADILIGDDKDNFISGFGGNDLLAGGNGSDTYQFYFRENLVHDSDGVIGLTTIDDNGGIIRIGNIEINGKFEKGKINGKEVYTKYFGKTKFHIEVIGNDIHLYKGGGGSDATNLDTQSWNLKTDNIIIKNGRQTAKLFGIVF